MAIPWLTVLQAVPWSEVIAKAPKVAEGAKKLWQRVGKKPATPASEGPLADSALPGEPPSLANLQARILRLEAAQADLHGQLLASAELIEALAEQNTLLIGRAELLHKRLGRLQVLVGILTIVAVAALLLGR